MKKRRIFAVGLLLVGLALVSGCFRPNSPPTALFTCDPPSGHSPLIVQFDASLSCDSDGEIIDYEWNFGNGQTENHQYVNTASVLYITETARTYIVTLVVTDDDGMQASAEEPITVSPPEPPPGLRPPFIIGSEGRKVTPFFVLNHGLAIFQLSHTGFSNFIVWLKDEEGERIALLANEIGGFDGSTSIHVEETGNYFFDVTADGAWNIIVDQWVTKSAVRHKQKGKGV